MRKRYRLDEGTPMLVEEREDGILMRPAATRPVDAEAYTPERLAEKADPRGADHAASGLAPGASTQPTLTALAGACDGLD